MTDQEILNEAREKIDAEIIIAYETTARQVASKRVDEEEFKRKLAENVRKQILNLKVGKLTIEELIKLSIRADKPDRSLEIVWAKGELPEVDEAYKDFGGNDSIWEESQLAMLKPPYNYHQVVGEEK